MKYGMHLNVTFKWNPVDNDSKNKKSHRNINVLFLTSLDFNIWDNEADSFRSALVSWSLSTDSWGCVFWIGSSSLQKSNCIRCLKAESRITWKYLSENLNHSFFILYNFIFKVIHMFLFNVDLVIDSLPNIAFFFVVVNQEYKLIISKYFWRRLN